MLSQMGFCRGERGKKGEKKKAESLAWCRGEEVGGRTKYGVKKNKIKFGVTKKLFWRDNFMKNDRNTSLLQQVYNNPLTWGGSHTL
jgi:hypothetical protein